MRKGPSKKQKSRFIFIYTEPGPTPEVQKALSERLKAVLEAFESASPCFPSTFPVSGEGLKKPKSKSKKTR